MIDAVLADISAAAERELARAKQEHGDTYHSLHEGYGVMAEEVQEAGEEAEQVDLWLERLLLAIRLDDRVSVLKRLNHVRDNALLAACEYVQVAAVCAKMAEGVKAHGMLCG